MTTVAVADYAAPARIEVTSDTDIQFITSYSLLNYSKY